MLAEESQKGLYADLAALNAKHIAGGAAQNTARGAQFALPPNSVLYIGAVGADEAAQTLREASGAAGLATEYMVVPDVPTGRCGVVITGKNRSLCTDLAAANCYKVDHLKQPQIWAHAQAASFFYVGSFHLTVSPEAAETLGREAAEKNKPFVLNLSAPFLPLAFKDPLASIIQYADIVIGNETEAGAWAQSQGWSDADQKDVPKIAKAIAALPKHNSKRQRIVIITQGTDATLLAEGANVRSFPVAKIAESQIYDTNGAGDAFAGGFMAGLVEGKDLPTSIDMGHWLARLSIQELGPSYVTFLFILLHVCGIVVILRREDWFAFPERNGIMSISDSTATTTLLLLHNPTLTLILVQVPQAEGGIHADCLDWRLYGRFSQLLNLVEVRGLQALARVIQQARANELQQRPEAAKNAGA